MAGFWSNLTNIPLDPGSYHAEFFPKLDTARLKRIIPLRN